MLNPQFKDTIRDLFNKEVVLKYPKESAKCQQLFDSYFEALLKLLSNETKEKLYSLEKAQQKQLADNLARNIGSCIQRMPGANDTAVLKAAIKSFQTDMPTTIDMLAPNLKAINEAVGTDTSVPNQIGAAMAIKIVNDMQTDKSLKSSGKVNPAFTIGVLGANLGIALNTKLAGMSPLSDEKVKAYMKVFTTLCQSMIAEFSNQGSPYVVPKGQGKFQQFCIDPAVLKSIVETAAKLADSPRLQLLDEASIKKYGSELVSTMVSQGKDIAKNNKKGFPVEQDMQKQLEAIDMLNTRLSTTHDKQEMKWSARFLAKMQSKGQHERRAAPIATQENINVQRARQDLIGSHRDQKKTDIRQELMAKHRIKPGSSKE
ncbi:MAG: hypothetical protein JSR17_00910 [Proteobacteria bacterium]|nr:hypothetical protein [Pseudomonadota bacterium]